MRRDQFIVLDIWNSYVEIFVDTRIISTKLTIAGCGKTILWWVSWHNVSKETEFIFSSTIIEDVNDRLRGVQNTAVLYHYFDFGNKIESSAESFLRSLIAQLLKQTSRLPKALDQLSRDKFRDTRYGSRMAMQAESVAQPSLLELSNTLHDSMEDFDHIYIILDALDECVERQKLLPIVRRLLSSKTGKTHIFVTSRSDADLEEYLTPIATAHVLIESNLIEPDIRSYIQEQLNDNPRLRRWPKKFQERIKSALMTGAQGMYVLKLH